MEITETELKKQAELSNKLAENINEFQKICGELYDARHYNDYESRNVKLLFLKEIYSKYKYDTILNCYGDIFYIVEQKGNSYIGKRVLWNLDLSNENYTIEEDVETDDDGEYNGTYYTINVITED